MEGFGVMRYGERDGFNVGIVDCFVIFYNFVFVNLLFVREFVVERKEE